MIDFDRNRTRTRERYWERKLSGHCVQCGAGLQDSDATVHCVECREARLARLKSEEQRAKARVREKTRQAKLYWANPQAFRDKQNQRRQEKRLRGECRQCSCAALEDSDYCATHREIVLARGRMYAARRRAARKAAS